jgi:hypothetical protein
LIPVIVYTREASGDITKTCAWSEVFLSDDLKHSNQMVQHVLNSVVQKLVVKNTALSHVHIWSDGCGDQLKNRWQAYFICTHGFRGIHFSHNFFQSCHGKGPSDSEGAVIKVFLRRMEFKNYVYIQTSENAYDLCRGDRDGDWIKAEVEAEKLKALRHVKIKHQITDKFLETKCRHTICARSFHFVKTGVVKHLERPDVDKLKTKITKHYSMHQMATPAAVGFVERACFECKPCFVLDKTQCRLSAYVGVPHTEVMTVKAREAGVSTRRANHRVLMDSLEKKVVAGSNVLILTDESTWVIDRALGKPEELLHAITNHDNERIPAKQKVVRVYQYDVLKADAANNPLKHTYCLRTNTGVCSNKWCICGVNRGESEGGACYKQHIQTYRLSWLREPVNLVLSTPRSSARRTARAPSSSSGGGSRPLAFYLDDLAQQKITQGMQAMPFV